MTATRTTDYYASFGGIDRTFRLTPVMIIELERECDAGIGAIAKRVFRNEHRHADVVSTIKLALIGGGMDPKEAAGLIAAYAVDRPLDETYKLAVAILDAAWFGVMPEKEAA